MLQLHNTFSGKTEEFKPLKGNEVRLYTCGPTVYDYAHIGNLRAYIFEDLLRRVLKLKGFKVTQVMNLTDVDDKTIQGAIRENATLDQYTEKYISAFYEDLAVLRIEKAEQYPRATHHIPEMIQLVERLIKSAHAYEKDGSVYYRISTFPGYGKLSKKNLEENIAGARVDSDEYDKEHWSDFVLWKAKKEGEPSWPSPFGEGRPGWHIECSAMSMKYLGETFDIHTGGEDNIFPHHENEIAQSEGATSKPFVKYWLHCKFLLVDGEKMSKSKGNFYTLKDLIKKGYDPLAVRYLLLSHHYRHPVNFTIQGLEDAGHVIARLKDFRLRLNEYKPSPGTKADLKRMIEEAGRGFEEALSDDLNISEALGVFFNLVREVNKALDQGVLSADEKSAVNVFLEKVNMILDLWHGEEAEEAPKEIVQMANDREAARRGKDFKRADELRNLILEKGYTIEDTKQGIRIKKK